MRSLFLLALFGLLISCETNEKQPLEPTSDNMQHDHDHNHRHDVHSYSQPEVAKTTHLDLKLTVDFDKKQLSGTARYKIEHKVAKQVILDTRDLNIEEVTLNRDTPTTFQLGENDPILGRALTIDLVPGTQYVNIKYSTIPGKDDAVDWLDASQTADKQFPFLFTQGQSILTRTWIPIQDSPGVRLTYDATITVPKGMMAVMSATNPQATNDSGVYTFKMKQPIPPYLIALAAGHLEFMAIGDETGVYAEPSVVKAAHYEFGDMQKMLESAEAMYGDYLWDRYDIIVLPPSFPFGGMENPRLTFATPTILAGDRSLTSLVAHELAHSWSGNLVTNATWNDFWLNEGFTVYFERRIMEALYGADYAEMLAELGFQDLENTVADMGADNPDTRLKTDLKGRDADDGMNDIPYEKGAAFLVLLEQKVGRAKFDAFLKKYFDEHRFSTLTTEEFVKYLKTNLLEPNQVEINYEEWIYQPGIPKNAPKVVSKRFAHVNDQTDRLRAGAAPNMLQTEGWTTHEWLHLIRQLPDDLSRETMRSIDREFGFGKSGNSEIFAAWAELSIRNGYGKEILPAIEDFLVRVGRRKFLTPLYRALKESDQLTTARAIYEKAKGNYHSVSRNSMEALLEVE